ncbi:MAG TPA: TIGR01459 family HAD-type hydrolase, partial [Roseiarcus sp.]|nr:TIGR01459 family HAD-type hydrolase [Roseiarcus sp.]
RAELEEASYVACTGLRADRVEAPSDYDLELRAIAARGLPMICANPDLVIHVGDALVYCAGSLAVRFEAIGGSVIYAGKPDPAIYRLALALAEKARGRPVDSRRVLAVGDGMRTDIAGARRMGVDALFVTRGVHREALHGDSRGDAADVDALRRLYEDHSLWPMAAIPRLAG